MGLQREGQQGAGREGGRNVLQSGGEESRRFRPLSVRTRALQGSVQSPSSAGNLGRLWMIDGAAASQIRLVAGYMAAIDVSTQHEFRE